MFLNRDGLKKPKKADIKPQASGKYIELSTLDLIKKVIIDKLLLGKNGAEAYHKLQVDYAEKEAKRDPRNNFEPQQIKAYSLAVILDGKVIEILRAQEKLADILLARPEFIIFSPTESKVEIGDIYEEGQFYKNQQGEPSQDTATE
jgi:hypothetical protein